MAEKEDDILDKLMPDPEGEKPADEFEVVISDKDPEETAAPENQDEEIEEETAPAEEEEEEKEDKSQPKSIQDRIKREIRLRKRTVERERAARLAAEARSDTDAAEKIAAQLAATGAIIQSKTELIEVVSERLVAAKEGGKTADEVKLQQRLNDLQGELREAKLAETRLKEVQSQPRKKTNPEADVWLGENKWYFDPEFSPEASAVREISGQLDRSKQYDPQSPEYFKELDRRIEQRWPGFRKRMMKQGMLTAEDQEEERKEPQKRRTPAAPAAERKVGGTPQSKTRVTLGPSDFAMMRQFRLDPDNKAHLQQYAKEKMAAQRGER